MIDHYNAFISYKHAPEDNLVAETIQRELERFHIPLKIRKQTGIKRINRIFRDKNELPITSDLSETISHALENSDYLIVICSTNTKESAWVPREIEYFLRNHSISQVLTVLVNGEPEDVIPEILTRNVEPLSCDYRMPIRKANKIELPRLASALIGCSYDELMNRRRQYVMRRVIFGFSAILIFMLLFSGYMLYSRNQIRKNYITALKNQSRYLSNESKTMLENEQRITALLLALEAMPKDSEDDRPIIPEAVNALSKAVRAYESESPDSVHNQWNYTISNKIDTFKVSPNGATLTAIDSEGQVYLWDTSTHKNLLSTSRDLQHYHGIIYVSYDKLLIWGATTIMLIDANTGDTLWQFEDEKLYLYPTDPDLIDDKVAYFLSSDSEILSLNLETGEITDKNKLNGLEITDYVTMIKLSPDKSKIALPIASGTTNVYRIGVYDLKTKNFDILSDDLGYVSSICWLDESTVVFSDIKDVSKTSARFMDTSVTSNDVAQINCIDIKDSSVVWENEFRTNNVSTKSDFIYIKDKNHLYYYGGDSSTLYDAKSGEEICTYNTNSTIVYAKDINGNGYPLYFTEDGNACFPINTDKEATLASQKYFTDSIKTFDSNNGYYINKYDSNEIIYYQTGIYDTNWKPLSEDLVIQSLYSSKLNDDTLIILSGEEEETTVTCFAFKDNFRVKQFIIPGKHCFESNILGYYNNHIYLASNDDGHLTLYKGDLDTGNMDTIILCDSYAYSEDIPEIKNGKIIYTYSEAAKPYIAIYDINTETASTHELPLEFNALNTAPEYFSGSNCIYISSDKDLIFNIKNGETSEVKLPEKWNTTSLITSNESGEFVAVSDKNSILIVDQKGTPIYDIKSTGVPITALKYYENKKSDDEDMILVLYNGGTLSRYSAIDGSYIGSTEISYENSYQNTGNFDFDYDEGLVYIEPDSTLDIIETSTWNEVTSIKNCMGHHSPSDRFITYTENGKGEYRIGYFERYTPAELVEKAKEMIGDAKLTEEQKAKYGIED